jgi:SAM-dependent methyltransferase
LKLNLASGRRNLEGWHNVDISSEVSPDEVRDLLKFPWPWADAEEISCSHFIEHIGDEFIPFMDECYRVLVPGGLFTIVCPYYTSIRTWQDPTHKRPICENLFYYFSLEHRKKLGVDHYLIKSDFTIKEFRYHYPDNMKDMPEEEREYMRLHAWNIVTDIEILLTK